MDTNVVFSGLIVGGKTRELILAGGFDPYVPAYFDTEVRNHRRTLRKKTGLSAEQLDSLLDELTTVPKAEFRDSLPAAEAAIANTDPDDVPFVGLAIYLGCRVWSDDSHFQGQDLVPVITPTELVERTDP